MCSLLSTAAPAPSWRRPFLCSPHPLRRSVISIDLTCPSWVSLLAALVTSFEGVRSAVACSGSPAFASSSPPSLGAETGRGRRRMRSLASHHQLLVKGVVTFALGQGCHSGGGCWSLVLGGGGAWVCSCVRLSAKVGASCSLSSSLSMTIVLGPRKLIGLKGRTSGSGLSEFSVVGFRGRLQIRLPGSS
ncbi:armadillo/beta-catenin-like repeat [Striga asiatica]|uniref:Armadillo/beta-catenin-like repeat n=1 Tax=Striga asiatica TaxID=4170 RepID=A0A5A7QZF2_STRAF|nr:armadillo/beta-catenin-like repeat [Striga asiatica]